MKFGRSVLYLIAFLLFGIINGGIYLLVPAITHIAKRSIISSLNSTTTYPEAFLFSPQFTQKISTVPLLFHDEDSINNATLQLEAHIVQGRAALQEGLVWRIFERDPFVKAKLNLVAEHVGGGILLYLQAGEYFIHLAFGNAIVTDSILLSPGERSERHFILNAGGIKFNATLLHGTILDDQVKFAIYADSYSKREKSLILQDIHPGTIIRLNEDIYHVVSNYGRGNAVVYSDIQIKAGDLIEISMQHRAAQVTLRLIREKDGEALADTRWIVMNDSGDVVSEIANAYANVILAEGEYSVMAQHKGHFYHKAFSVSSGYNQVIDILTEEQNLADQDSMD